MNKVYLLTGSNMDDRKENLAQARFLINRSCGKISKASPVYETAAWGKEDQSSFFNQALAINTSLSPQELLKKLLKTEEIIGRIRNEKYGPRIIDIDILLFNNKIIAEESLEIPHPELQNRRFALTPLAEIAGDIMHPVLKKTISKLLDECTDPLPVKKII